MTAPNTHTITYLRHRKNRHYLEVDGRKVRVTESVFPRYEIDYDTDNPVSFVYDGIHTLYRDSEREWDERANTYFYPYASPDDVALVNKINAAILQTK